MKHESTTQPGLFFWAQQNPVFAPGRTPTYAFIFQMTGFPATEAHDDWFGNESDADAIAKQFALGEFTFTP